MYTTAEQAADFVAKTNVDSLAIAIAAPTAGMSRRRS